MDARSSELAWAAGIFDGEGSTSTYLRRERKTPRRQIAVSQGGVPGEFPAVLVRFMSIVGAGNITGPYDGLYYWKTTRKDAVDSVGAMLWPYLSYEKRRQFEAAALRMKRPVPAPIDDARVLTPDLAIAWAAGLFDGEGTFSTHPTARRSSSRRRVSMSIPQASAGAVPEPLIRFRAVVGVGNITGPRIVPSPWSRLPQYRWRADGRHVVSAAARAIWPWLGPVKRAE